MKKLITLVLMVGSFAFGQEIFTDVDLTPVASTNTAVATYTVTGSRVVYPMALFQAVAGTTQTNTVTLSVIPAGQTNAYTVDTLAAVVSGGKTLETFGIGDVTADVDPIWLNTGDKLQVGGAGTDAGNVTYRLRLKVVNQ